MKHVFILASASPRRKELVSHLKIPFVVLPANIDEEVEAPTPSFLVEKLAIDKGLATHKQFRKEHTDPCFILSADTLVALGNKIYSKPKDQKDAARILLELSGKTHQVFTGVSFIYENHSEIKTHSFVVESLVTFDLIGNEILQIYLDTKESLDKAGAYGIQGPSLTFISKLEGSYSNVVGLPLSDVVREIGLFLGANSPSENWRDIFK